MRSTSTAATPRARPSRAPGATGAPASFGALLRYWRGKRGLSQLELGADSGISQRHLSFLESGRAMPSREMVLKLGLVLNLPLRQRNAMLLAAGYAPAYRERPLSDPELAEVMQAIDFMLVQQEPYPAIVVDRLWNPMKANGATARMLQWLLGPPEQRDPQFGAGANLILLMLHPAALRPWITNWHEVAGDAIHWIHREALADGPDGEARALLERLLAIDGLPADWRVPNLESRLVPFMPLRIAKDGVELAFFTTITTLGTPHDVTLNELRIELFHPADAATRDWMRDGGGARR